MSNIRRNLVYNFIRSISQVLIPLLSTPYVSRILDPEGIGKVSFIDSFTYYFVSIAEFGIMLYGIREVSKERGNYERLSQLVSELITLHVITSSCTLVLYAISVFILWNKIGDVRLIFFSVSFLIVNAFTCEWYFLGTEKFSFITLRSLTARLLGLASIFLLIKRPDDYYIYYAIIAGSAIVTHVWNNAILFREVRISLRTVNWKKHLKFVWIIYLINLFYSVPLMLDNVLLRLVNTASAVGLYAFSIKVVRIGAALITDPFLVFFPRVVSLARDKHEDQLQEKLLSNIRLVVLMSVPMGAGLWLIADELTMVFFGNKFLQTAQCLRLLSIYPFLKGLGLFLSNPVLIAHGKERVYLRNLMMGICLFVILAPLLGFYYSYLGACIALIFVEFFIVALNYLSAKKLLPGLKIFDNEALLHALLGSSLFVPFVQFIKSEIVSDFGKLVISVIGCSCIYILFLFFVVRNNFVRQVKSYLFDYFFKRTR